MKVEILNCEGSIKSEPKNMKARKGSLLLLCVLIKRIKDDQSRATDEGEDERTDRADEGDLNLLKAKLSNKRVECAIL